MPPPKNRNPAGDGGAHGVKIAIPGKIEKHPTRGARRSPAHVADHGRRASRDPEFIYDGRDLLGSLVAGRLGFEIYDANDRYVATVETLGEATGLLHSSHQIHLVRVGVAR